MRRPGFTLLELALVLALLAALVIAAVPVLARARAIFTTRAASAEIVAAIAATRAQAVLTGGAQLVITPGGELRIERADGLPLGDPVRLGARYSVSVTAPGGLPVVLRYDALGIGRLTNATVHVRRADTVVTVTVSAYGRART